MRAIIGTISARPTTTVTAPIASARTVEQLATILPMADLVLAPDEIAALTEASEDTRLAG